MKEDIHIIIPKDSGAWHAKQLVRTFRRIMEAMKGANMDEKALIIVKDYIREHLDKSDPNPEFEVYTVWKAKVLQNWKYLISSTLYDGMYYELTYNGDKDEWYLDAYKKFENRKISDFDFARGGVI